MIWAQLYWREPWWLLLALLPAAVWILGRLRQRKIMAGLVDAELMPWVHCRVPFSGSRRASWLLMLSWLLFSVALAGPRTPYSVPPNAQPPAAAVMIIIDHSVSMLAGDVQPDRGTAVRRRLTSWLQDIRPGLRVGLLIYAGHAHLLLRPTDDHALLAHYIAQLPGIRLPTLGNDLTGALERSIGVLRQETGRRYLLVFTDGDLGADAQRDALTVGDLRALHAIESQLIGVGDSEPAAVPLDPLRQLFIDGEPVFSRLQSSWLRRLADVMGGDYHPLAALPRGSLADFLDLPVPRIDPAHHTQVLWREWFPIPLLTGILLLLRVLYRPAVALSSQGLLLPVALLLMSVQDTLWADAGAEYAAAYGTATRCYRQKDYACALQGFARAARLAENDLQRGRAAFNLGNCYFYLGDYAQAEVLFSDAGKLGVSMRHVAPNRDFAASLDRAVRRRLQDIAETERRAAWRNAAGEIPEALRDRLAEEHYLSRPKTGSGVLQQLSKQQLQALLARGTARLRTSAEEEAATDAVRTRQWVLSPQDAPAGNTASVFNQLLPLELGLPVAPDRPQRLSGQRPW